MKEVPVKFLLSMIERSDFGHSFSILHASLSWLVWLSFDTKVYSEPCQTSKIEIFAKVVND